MQWIIPSILSSYLIGSIPTAYIFVKLIKGVDIRTVGSKNVGATNAMRVLGKPLGIAVLLLDIAKGVIPVFLIGNILVTKNVSVSAALCRALLAIACIAGHNWSVFLRFRGGRGVATTLGVLIGLAITVESLRIILLFALAVWVIAFITFRIVSLASIFATISFPLLIIAFGRPKELFSFSLLLAALIITRHIPNIKRLFKGQESPLKL